MFCTHCGTQIAADVRFCTTCGQPTANANVQSTTHSAHQTHAQAAQSPGQNPVSASNGWNGTPNQPSYTHQRQTGPTMSPAFTSYSQVPFYRKNWFLILSFLFCTPLIAFLIVLTGPVYYMKNGQVTPYSRTQKAFVIIFSIIWLIAVFNKTMSESSTASPAGSSQENQSAMLAVGSTAQTGDVEVTITSVETRQKVGGGMFTETASQGAVLVAVRWKYKNISTKPIDAFDQPSLKLVDPNGTQYEADLDASSSYATELNLTEKVLSDLNPGITVTGAAVFEVSKELYNEATWQVLVDGDDDLKFSIGQPVHTQVAQPLAVQLTTATSATDSREQSSTEADLVMVPGSTDSSYCPEMDDYTNMLRQAGLKGELVDSEESDEPPDGPFCAYGIRPKPGTKVKKGVTVTFKVAGDSEGQ